MYTHIKGIVTFAIPVKHKMIQVVSSSHRGRGQTLADPPIILRSFDKKQENYSPPVASIDKLEFSGTSRYTFVVKPVFRIFPTKKIARANGKTLPITVNLQGKADQFSVNYTANVVPYKDSRFTWPETGVEFTTENTFSFWLYEKVQFVITTGTVIKYLSKQDFWAE